MTSHELAKRLLEFPDCEIMIPAIKESNSLPTVKHIYATTAGCSPDDFERLGEYLTIESFNMVVDNAKSYPKQTILFLSGEDLRKINWGHGFKVDLLQLKHEKETSEL